MGISKTPLYICDSCNYTSSNPYFFRIIEGRVRIGNQTLVRGYDFKPEVICIDCFCHVMGIGHNCEDVHNQDSRYKHIDPAYTGEDKDDDKSIDKDEGEE